jgi:hypothetical protein
MLWLLVTPLFREKWGELIRFSNRNSRHFSKREGQGAAGHSLWRRTGEFSRCIQDLDHQRSFHTSVQRNPTFLFQYLKYFIIVAMDNGRRLSGLHLYAVMAPQSLDKIENQCIVILRQGEEGYFGDYLHHLPKIASNGQGICHTKSTST